MKYDYLLVGAGLFNAVVAYHLRHAGKSVLCVERRQHVGGNCYTENINGIEVHKYGAHIFRTDDKCIWDFVNSFVEFNNFINSPLAVYKDELYNLPFNMNTFSKMWNIRTPEEAKLIIELQRVPNDNPKNLEEHILSLVGKDVYEKLIKGYTEKQWGVKCTELSPDVMKRVPIRFTYDNNYYSGKRYQGIPIDGYSCLIQRMFGDTTILYGVDGAKFVRCNPSIADKIIYTGCIDEFYSKRFGSLKYRSLRFDEHYLDIDDYQGNAVVNYTDVKIPYTRIIEHKHFTDCKGVKGTVITKEYPQEYSENCEPFYPMNDADSICVLRKYQSIDDKKIIFGGRLGSYLYTDMEDTIKNAIALVSKLL